MKYFLPSFLLSLAIVLASYFVSAGIRGWASNNRTIEVKGVSERLVEADQAFWPLKFSVNGADLSSAQLKLDEQKQLVTAYLLKQGIKASNIVPQGFEINDAKLNPYENDAYRAGDKRVIITQTLLVSSDEPQRVLKASEEINELVSKGVSISVGAEYMSTPNYVFSKLNDHKPEMLTLAIGSAREAAERFALESKSKLGGIKNGSQGVFSILPRHQFDGAMESKQIEKVLRVVTSVTYYID